MEDTQVMKINYLDRDFKPETLATIERADAICLEYAAQGFTLTLRQLYYQFVARGLIPNKDTEYKRLGSILNDARLAGLIDWSHMVDRTRNLQAQPHWTSPEDIISAAASGYAIDKWSRQPWHVEVWIEKDALVGVIDPVCSRNDVPYFSCRGYTSQSEVWGAAMRLVKATTKGNSDRRALIIHLGDHDPSGIDMTRDVTERLALFATAHGARRPKVKRIALNMDQVLQYDPPPNPTKLTDSRANAYLDLHGYESWELDALEPTVIDALIEEAIDEVRDADQWMEDVQEQETHRAGLQIAARRWLEVQKFLAS
jgi:hypothetical protein